MQNSLSTPVLYLILLLSGLFWAMLGLGYKVADHHSCRTGSFSRVMFFSAGVICGVALLVENTNWGNWRLWALGIAAGVLFYLVLLLLMPTYRLGPASVVWIVVNLGILIPIFLSPLFKETLYWFIDPILIGLFVLMLLAFQRGMAQARETTRAGGMLFLFALLSVFLANGILLAAPKWQSIMFHGADRIGYLTISYFAGGVFTLLIDASKGESLRPTAWEWKAGLLSGMSTAIGMLFFMTAIKLPAAVVFSINGGISLLGGVALTTIIYRERLNLMKVVGLALGTLVLLIAVLRAPLAKQWHLTSSVTNHGQLSSEKSAQ